MKHGIVLGGYVLAVVVSVVAVAIYDRRFTPGTIATGLEVAVGGCALLYFLLSASPVQSHFLLSP